MSPSVLHARPQRSLTFRNQRTRRVTRAPRASDTSTTVLLIRHGSHDLIDQALVGRMPGVPLNAAGICDAERLARRLGRHGITRVHTSPRQRAIETATIIARTARVPMQIAFPLDEIDVGAWTGLSFAELAKDGRWAAWNLLRSLTTPPGGETIREVQERIVRYLTRVRTAHPGGRIALVTHAEVIRAAIMHAEGISLDAHEDIKIAPATSVALTIDERGARLAGLGGAS